jgi:hypothetical protein
MVTVRTPGDVSSPRKNEEERLAIMISDEGLMAASEITYHTTQKVENYSSPIQWRTIKVSGRYEMS